MVSPSCKLRAAIALLVLACIQSGCQAYPQLFATKHAKTSCIDHPSRTQLYGMHGRLVPDPNVTIQLLSGTKPVQVLCPGGTYQVKVSFPQSRLALVTASMATLRDATNSSCPNQMVTPKTLRVRSVKTLMSVSCAAAGRELDFKVTSAGRKSAVLGFTRALIPVDAASAPRCAVLSQACAPARPVQIVGGDNSAGAAAGAAGAAGGGGAAAAASGTTFVPLTPGAVDYSRSEAKDAKAAKAVQEPVYQLYPVLNENRWLWQFLHSLLMLLSFCFLLPLGSLLARHKWIFGRDELSGRVLRSWGPVHVITQILGLLAAVGGVTIAILAFGWKDVPGQKLYTPHKWAGVGVMGMAIVQGLLGMLRPQADTRGRGCWNALHHNWGRVTILAGMGNAVLGALLIHDLKDESYLNWLLPACVLIGLVAITAIALEAFKLQMQRTYRYHGKSGTMLPVMEGFKHSKRRPGGGAAKFAAAGSGGAAAAAAAAADHQSDSDDGHAVRDTEPAAVSDQGVMYPAVNHRAGPAKTSIRPPQI